MAELSMEEMGETLQRWFDSIQITPYEQNGKMYVQARIPPPAWEPQLAGELPKVRDMYVGLSWQDWTTIPQRIGPEGQAVFLNEVKMAVVGAMRAQAQAGR